MESVFLRVWVWMHVLIQIFAKTTLRVNPPKRNLKIICKNNLIHDHVGRYISRFIHAADVVWSLYFCECGANACAYPNVCKSNTKQCVPIPTKKIKKQFAKTIWYTIMQKGMFFEPCMPQMWFGVRIFASVSVNAPAYPNVCKSNTKQCVPIPTKKIKRQFAKTIWYTIMQKGMFFEPCMPQMWFGVRIFASVSANAPAYTTCCKNIRKQCQNR